MRRYWYEGNSENFIYLLFQMEKLEQRLLAPNDDNGEEAAVDPLGAAREYFASFKEQAPALWDQLVAPFSRRNEDDINDFVADEEEEEAESSIPHYLVDRQQEACSQEQEQAEDEELVRYYQEKAGGNGDDVSGYSDEENLDDAFQGSGESESSSEDDWVKGIRNKRRRGSRDKPSGANKRPGRESTKSSAQRRRRLSRAGKTRNGAAALSLDSSSGAEEMNDFDARQGPTKKRAILEDSESE